MCALDNFGEVTLCVIRVDRSHMGEDLGSVETNPVEGGVGEDVDIVP